LLIVWPHSAAAPARDRIQRGEYLVDIMGCNHCHTPRRQGPHGPEPDPSLLLSGHPAAQPVSPGPGLQGPWVWAASRTNTAFAGPWGVSFAANLTSDRETGMGGWTDADFKAMARRGKHLGRGRDILPPMPWISLRDASDGDLEAILAYLKSTRPIRNRVPDAVEPGRP
jgi:hypothetical protein